MSSNPHIDHSALKDLKEIMEDDFGLLIDTFIADSELRISHLEKAIAASDSELIRTTAHSFKGSSSNVCAPLLAELCRELEAAGKDGELGVVPALFADIKAEFSEVVRAFSSL